MNTPSTLSRRVTPLPVAAAGRLQTRAPGRLRVIQGRVWVTVDGQAVDHVLSRGDELPLHAGQQAVVEPWTRGVSAHLLWQAEPARQLSWIARVISAAAGRASGRPVGRRAEPAG